MHFAVSGLIAARWTDEIHAEWTRNLLAKQPNLLPERVARTLQHMQNALPDATITNYEPLVMALKLPDPDDRHVLAAAIHAEAEALITLNTKDFPEETLRPHGIVAFTPDQLTAKLLLERPNPTCEAVQALRESFSRPPYSPSEFADRLRGVGLHAAASCST